MSRYIKSKCGCIFPKYLKPEQREQFLKRKAERIKNGRKELQKLVDEAESRSTKSTASGLSCEPEPYAGQSAMVDSGHCYCHLLHPDIGDVCANCGSKPETIGGE